MRNHLLIKGKGDAIIVRWKQYIPQQQQYNWLWMYFGLEDTKKFGQLRAIPDSCGREKFSKAYFSDKLTKLESKQYWKKILSYY